jgi:glyoxylase-like metal-dependent hydrolase (beta-lactamase superfamily II)
MTSRRIKLALLVSILVLSVRTGLAQTSGMSASPADLSAQAKEPFKIFDNLSFVGIEFVASYVLTTSDGLIIIDALFGDDGFGDYLLDNVRKLGFDPSDIRYVIVTHGHRDHYGLARELQDRTDAVIGNRMICNRTPQRVIDDAVEVTVM